MATVISALEQVTPGWLTGLLQRENALPFGSVIAIEWQSNAAFNSHTFHLKPTYSMADSPLSPHRLLLKCSLPEEWAKRAGVRGVAFYETVKSLPDHPAVIVRCYDAVYDADSGNSHILQEDLSDSHVIPVMRDNQINLIDNLPSDKHLEQIVDALARFHAYWWEHPQLGTGTAPLSSWCSDEEHYAAEIERRRRAWDDRITDYQLSILDWLWSPVQDRFDGSGKAYWWPKMNGPLTKNRPLRQI